MKMRLLMAAFALAGLLGSGQSLAQNAYITSQSSGTVSVVDTVTNMVTATIAIGKFNQSGGVAVSPDGNKVYLTNDGTDPSPGATGTVSVIATATNTVTATIPVGSGPQGLAVTPDGGKVYVANSGFNTVSVIATATNRVTATIPVGLFPFGVAVSPDGSKVLCRERGRHRVGDRHEDE